MGVSVRILELSEQSYDHLFIYFDRLEGLGIATMGDDLADGARLDVQQLVLDYDAKFFKNLKMLKIVYALFHFLEDFLKLLAIAVLLDLCFDLDILTFNLAPPLSNESHILQLFTQKRPSYKNLKNLLIQRNQVSVLYHPFELIFEALELHLLRMELAAQLYKPQHLVNSIGLQSILF